MNDQARAKQTASTIIAQLGGRKFIAMTGAKNFSHGYDMHNFPYVLFRLGRFPNVKIKMVGISLTDRDDYTMRFFAKDAKLVEVREGIYCDWLQGTFCEVTGLDTRL